MFKHSGTSRTYLHNQKIATLLSFVAGMVNVVGFLSVHELTTNVTGHFAFFVEEILQFNFSQSLKYFVFIFFFFAGSFVSNLSVELFSRNHDRHIYRIPVLTETILLFSVAILGKSLIVSYPEALACSLLFAMGMQNSLVTSISNSVVRTTHLTGLFTDLGIELSQLMFYKKVEQKQALISSIKLRLYIINFFFLGGLTGGFVYIYLKLHTLWIAGGALLMGLIYDDLKVKVKRIYQS